MSQNEIDILQRALEREKEARKQAEKILEDKSVELFEAKQKLEKSYAELKTKFSKTDSLLQGVFENIADAYVIIDLKGNLLKMNDSSLELLGFNDKKVDYNLMNMVYPEDIERVTDSFKQLLETGKLTNFEIKIKTNLNQKKVVHINASIIYYNNIPIAAQGIVRDITENKKAESKLIESEDRLATLILNLDAGVLLEDENRRIILTNKKFCEIFKIPLKPEDLIGVDCSDSAEQSKFLFEDPDDFVKDIDVTIRNRKAVLGKELIMTNGNIFERDYIPIFRNGVYKGHFWTYKDFTLRRRYRKSLEVQKQKYSNIIANIDLGLVEFDTEDKILFVNQSFLEMSGYTKKELIGKNVTEIFPTDAGKKILKKEDKKLKKGIPRSFEIEIKNKTGKIRYWLISVAQNYNLSGEVIGGIGIHLDITNLKNLEIQKENLLSRLEKSNAELQEYAHIVSHDLKSPLRSISALVNWLKEDNKGKLDKNSLQNFSLIETTLEKMDQLITDVLNYSSVGSDTSEKVDVDLNNLFNELLKILYIPKYIKVKILKTLPVVKGDKTRLQQLFLNLLSNAIKFIEKDKGIVLVDVVDSGTHYKFSIKDNGIGIDKKFHDKIFKIFHALNKSENSTGIGLSIVKKIVDLHEGEIWLESEPQKGTTFYFTLKK